MKCYGVMVGCGLMWGYGIACGLVCDSVSTNNHPPTTNHSTDKTRHPPTPIFHKHLAQPNSINHLHNSTNPPQQHQPSTTVQQRRRHSNVRRESDGDDAGEDDGLRPGLCAYQASPTRPQVPTPHLRTR